jgi:nucleotidyltransferase/DNA polymerase involved in DNA repair
MQRIIAHLDMDAFFASVEEITTPGLSGKPIVVGATSKRGVVSAANYKAREYGIHSAQPITIARRLAKKAEQEVIFLGVDMPLYEKVSNNIFEIIKKHSNKVEQASIDEFYIDLSFLKTFSKAEKVCKGIKEEIKQKQNLTCSIGIGNNKLISKIASSESKPNGFLLIKDNQSFLNPLNIKKIPGIGPKTAKLLNNFKTIKDLSKLSKSELKNLLGKAGIKIYYSARGINNDPIVEYREAKSIGRQSTFEENTTDILIIFDRIEELSESVFQTFKESNFSKFKTITITIRFSNFQTKTSSKSFKKGIDNKKEFNINVIKLLLPFLDKRKNPRKKPIRLIGVRIENLDN